MDIKTKINVNMKTRQVLNKPKPKQPKEKKESIENKEKAGE